MSEQPLYHGTRAAFRGSGGLLLPGSQYGIDNHGLGRSDWVYVTPDRDLAAAYAIEAKGRNRPRVLTVRPMYPVEVDDSTINGEEQDAYRTKGCRVLRTEMLTDEEIADLSESREGALTKQRS